MTLSGLLADFYRRLGYAASPAAEVTTRATAFLNETEQDILAEPGLASALLQGTLTFASVADQAEYGLPPSIARIKAITERTNDVRLVARSLDWYRSVEPDPTQHTGVSDAWVPLGLASIATKPSNASELFVDSTSASDTGTAYVEVVRTGGYRRLLSVTMTGVTAVSLGTAITDALDIVNFYISAAAVGTVTLHEDASGGTELARIPIGDTRSRYQRIALWPTPASALTYYVDYEREVGDLVNANDEPVLPPKFHRLLGIGARVKEYEKREDTTRMQMAQAEYRKVLADLKYAVLNPPDYRPSLRPLVVLPPPEREVSEAP